MPVNAVELFALLLGCGLLALAHGGFHGVQAGFQLAAHGANVLPQAAAQGADGGVDALAQGAHRIGNDRLGLGCGGLLLLPKLNLQLHELLPGLLLSRFRVKLFL